MSEFWKTIRNKVQKLDALDEDRKLVCGSYKHQYKILPRTSLKEIEFYERTHEVQLPDAFRDYLLHFGSGGVGPGEGIGRFPEQLGQGDLNKPLTIEYFQGTSYEENYPKSLYDMDGMIDLGYSVYDRALFLVVHGPLRGFVVHWNFADILSIGGPFNKWYERWVDCAITGIRQYRVLQKLEIGMDFDSIVERENLLVEHISDHGQVWLRYTGCNIFVDSDRRIVKFKNWGTPTGLVDFMTWPYLTPTDPYDTD